MKDSNSSVVLAYSGGLDTSVILKWLILEKKLSVIAFTADVGQGENLKEVKEKALKTGALKIYVEDFKEEFAKDFVFSILRANAVYEGDYFLGTSIARPLIAKKQLEVAHKEGARIVSHGATGKGNDQVRFELTYYALDPEILVIAPWREWGLNSRSLLIDYARRFNIPVSLKGGKAYSIDRNMLHVSYEAGILEDPWVEPDEAMYTMTVSPQNAPDEPTIIEIDYADGNPVAINNNALSPFELVDCLNKAGGKNGIGRVDMVENRFIGMKNRGVYESPGAAILHAAHRAIESITMDREVMRIRDGLVPKYAELIYNGFWYSPEREALQVFFDHVQKGVSGTVRLKLFKGGIYVLGRKSPVSLYDPKFATFEASSSFDQKDAEGFVKINALRLKLIAFRDRKLKQWKEKK